MNILHLKYAVEIERTASVTKAAENLFMGQPNLSRSVKELEESCGIKIFQRTARGMVPTPEGRKFLARAKKLLSQIDEMEALYRPETGYRLSLCVAAPGAEYLSRALAEFAAGLDPEKDSELRCTEASPEKTVESLLTNECRMGVLRYPVKEEDAVTRMLEERGLKSEIIADFPVLLVASRQSPLLGQKSLTAARSKGLIRVCLSGPSGLEAFPEGEKKKPSPEASRVIRLSDRESCYAFLRENPNAYLWDTGVSQSTLQREGLAAKKPEGGGACRDALLSKREYQFSPLERKFAESLKKYGARAGEPV